MNETLLESAQDLILQDDLENIVGSNVPIEALRNKTILVTGATGLIGSIIVKFILCCNRIKHTNIRIIAFVRDDEKAKKIFGNLLNRAEIKLVVGDINQQLNIEEKISYIIHAASATESKYFITNPVETIKVILAGTENILKLADIKKIKSMVYISSMEVYGSVSEDKKFISENDLGDINILNVRSSYSQSKRMAECLCASYSHEYNVPVKIARLTRVIGPGIIDYTDNRMFVQFAMNIINKKDIVLHSYGNSVVNYCYTADTIAGLFYLLIKGENAEAYNITQTCDCLMVKEIAELLVKNYPETKVRVRYEFPDDIMAYGYNVTTNYILNTHKIEKLGWKANVKLEKAYRNMISSMLLGMPNSTKVGCGGVNL